ncbi:hypothetical protein HYW21_05845 [Candidatus Woesearchaeota archaeon]|nr:hypothetical protein [Candidatus Woesearchaeota archaeon]
MALRSNRCLYEKTVMLAKHNTLMVVLLLILPVVFSFSGEGNGYTASFTFNSFEGNGSSPNAYDVQMYGSKFPVIHGSGSGYDLQEGTIYLRKIAASNVSVGIGNTSIWSREGIVSNPEEITNFTTAFQEYLAGCVPDEQGYCLVPLQVFTGTLSSVKLSQVYLSLIPLMNSAPTLNLTIFPENPSPDDTITCRGLTYDLNDDVISVSARVSLRLGMTGITEHPTREISCVKTGLPGIYECNTTISADRTQPGHEVTCTMQAFDGEFYSEWVTATVIVSQSDEGDMVVVTTPVERAKPKEPSVVVVEPQQISRQNDDDQTDAFPTKNITDEILPSTSPNVDYEQNVFPVNLSPIDLILPNLTNGTVALPTPVTVKQLRGKKSSTTENETNVIQ